MTVQNPWPNRITLLRLGLAAVVVVLLAAPPPPSGGGRGAVAGVFLVAAATDWLDGWLARRTGSITAFGQFLDPLVDKMLVLGPLVLLVADGRAPAVGVVLILFREFAVSGLRMLAAVRGRVIAAAGGGKLKTAVQIAAVVLLIAAPDGAFLFAGLVLFWLSVALTLWSGWTYLRGHWDLFRTKEEA
ncbi:MAG: CDP-diacylglycerol--glycerol-3-phosphate 3-phosphatidyltransferase [Hydrogenibacillus schlegelii]|nr:CDP-diacylglycerol--glycerol-3-phosphate 3-phosphatidyltransferase [Hydrogenibacillus schlegelii]